MGVYITFVVVMSVERFLTMKATMRDFKNKNISIPLFWLIVSILICNSIDILKINNIFADNKDFQYYQPQHSSRELFQDLINADDESVDIAEVSLLLAKEEYTEINVADYLECIDWYARVLKIRISQGDGPKSAIKIINEFLFDELGFEYVQTGNLEDLHLNKVIDRRIGNCVGLSILYLSIAERLGLPLFGVNVPRAHLCQI